MRDEGGEWEGGEVREEGGEKEGERTAEEGGKVGGWEAEDWEGEAKEREGKEKGVVGIHPISLHGVGDGGDSGWVEVAGGAAVKFIPLVRWVVQRGGLTVFLCEYVWNVDARGGSGGAVGACL